MNDAAPSCRVATTRMPWAARPSIMPRMLSLGTVKAILTPDRASDAARAEPTVRVVLWPSVVDIAVLLQAVAPEVRATLTRGKWPDRFGPAALLNSSIVRKLQRD